MHRTGALPIFFIIASLLWTLNRRKEYFVIIYIPFEKNRQFPACFKKGYSRALYALD